MARITQNLFEAIQQVTTGEQDSTVQEGSVDKAHYCATHVEHALLGYGECISEQHAEPDENGDIAWYTVQFPTGTHKVNSDQLRIVEGKSHMHSKKMAEEKVDEKKLDPVGKEDADIDNDGDTDKSDSYLHNRRKAIGKAIRKEEAELDEEQIDELSKKTLGSYIKKSSDKAREHGFYGGVAFTKGKLNQSDYHAGKEMKRARGISKATDRLTKEEAHLDEADRTPKSKDPKVRLDWHNKKAEEAGYQRDDQGYKYHIKKAKDHADTLGLKYKVTGYGLKMEDSSMLKKTGNLPKKGKNPGSAAFNWKDKPESKFEKKQTATGTVYTRKQDKGTNESKTLTIIDHNNFVLEVTDNPTFKDYFDALQTIAPTKDENIQKEMVAIATEAYNEGYKEIIAEAMMKVAYADTVDSYIKQGYKLMGESYTVTNDEVFAEYMMEKEGSMYQYIYTGEIVPEEKE